MMVRVNFYIPREPRQHATDGFSKVHRNVFNILCTTCHRWEPLRSILEPLPGGDRAATVRHGKQPLYPAASRSNIVSITYCILKLTRNSSNRTVLQTPTVCVLRNVVVSLLLSFFITVLCADRVGQMTKTYNDIDAVTRLLEEVILLVFQYVNCS